MSLLFPPREAYPENMISLIVVLLLIWIILAVVGFAFKGLLWLAVIAIVLFVVTGVLGWIRRKAVNK